LPTKQHADFFIMLDRREPLFANGLFNTVETAINRFAVTIFIRRISYHRVGFGDDACGFGLNQRAMNLIGEEIRLFTGNV
jgi:hypothetical protein